jgi:class 3 adenylate cyclase
MHILRSSLLFKTFKKGGAIMVDEGFRRKLATILCADVKGYSRLMDDNEKAAVRTLTACRTAINDLVQQYLSAREKRFRETKTLGGVK